MEMRAGRQYNVIAAKTLLGWVVMGQYGEPEHCLFFRDRDGDLYEQVAQYIETDEFRLTETQEG